MKAHIDLQNVVDITADVPVEQEGVIAPPEIIEAAIVDPVKPNELKQPAKAVNPEQQ